MSIQIKTALVSVFDKTGVVEFVRFLVSQGVEIISTGGTARLLKENGIPVNDVAKHTGFPECLDGRVKTLHPMIHGGILFRRDKPEHVRTADMLCIKPIDLVIVNLYPFEETVAKPGVTHEEIIENIDIGGPSMVRSAAKNYSAVTVVTSPNQYSLVTDEMVSLDGRTSIRLRQLFAKQAFAMTADYDTAIANYFNVPEEE